MTHGPDARGAHRGPRPHQALRQLHRRRRPELRRRARPDHRLPRAQRRRQDDDPADAARPGRARPRARRPSAAQRYADIPHPLSRRGLGARGDELPPRPHAAATTCASWRPPAGVPARAGRRDARAGRHPGRGAQAGRWLLDGHAPAPRPGRRAARRPAGAHPRRAGQRPRPRGHPLAARLPAPPRPARAAPSSSPATCSREVEQTVDDVVIIANGRLRARRARSATLHGEPTAVVRTSDRDAWPARCAAPACPSARPDDDARCAAARRPAPGSATWPCGPACRSTSCAPTQPTSRSSSSSSPTSPRTATATPGARPPGPDAVPQPRRGDLMIRRDPASSASSSPPACGGAWRSRSSSPAPGFAVLFAFVFTSDAARRPGRPRRSPTTSTCVARSSPPASASATC